MTTISDGICVALVVDDPMDASARFVSEGTLHGIAARLVVALEYGESTSRAMAMRGNKAMLIAPN